MGFTVFTRLILSVCEPGIFVKRERKRERERQTDTDRKRRERERETCCHKKRATSEEQTPL